MTLEIVLDADSEEVNIILDSSVQISAYRRGEDDVVLSKGFNDIVDDETYDCMKDICKRLLRLVS